jgi:SAM-dependent methyltransferase
MNIRGVTTATRKLLKSIVHHGRHGTLLVVVRNRIRERIYGHAPKEPKGNQYYGDVARDYVEERQKQSWWHTEQEVMQKLLAAMPDRLSVLDVPFGTARFVPYYLAKGMTVHGLDISVDMIAAAKEALGPDFDRCDVKVGSAMDLPFAANSVDLVVSFRFLHSIVSFGDAKVALAELARVSRGSAIIELSERKKTSARARLPNDDEIMGGSLFPEEVEALLRGVGFRRITRSPLIKDQGSSEMYAYLCER